MHKGKGLLMSYCLSFCDKIERGAVNKMASVIAAGRKMSKQQKETGALITMGAARERSADYRLNLICKKSGERSAARFQNPPALRLLRGPHSLLHAD